MNRQVPISPEVGVDLAAIERTAVELAGRAGAEIQAALGSIFTVRYKTGTGDAVSLRDPVSEIDRNVEADLRARLAERFPRRPDVGPAFALF